MQGLDFRYKIINQVLNKGKPTSALFQTKAINLYMRVMNTLDTFCTSNPPQATVNMEDVFQTNFTVYNLAGALPAWGWSASILGGGEDVA
jgi:hypothetical protein